MMHDDSTIREFDPTKMPPIHPGEILRKEFMQPMKLSAGAIAKACHVPRTRTERVAQERTDITADTALRLSRYFGTSAEMWLNMQAIYDLSQARRNAQGLDDIKPYAT